MKEKLREIIRKFICTVIAVALGVTIGIPVYGATSVSSAKITLPIFSVTLNGTVVNNNYSKYPLIVYKDITYFPMTYSDCRYLGIESTWKGNKEGLFVDATGITAAYSPYNQGSRNGKSYMATIPSFPIKVNGKSVDNSKEQYPLLSFRDITYFPMTWKWGVDEFGWDYSFDNQKGLVINSDNKKIEQIAFSKDRPQYLCENGSYRKSDMVIVNNEYVYYQGNQRDKIYQAPLSDTSKVKCVFEGIGGEEISMGLSVSDGKTLFNYHMGGATMGSGWLIELKDNGNIKYLKNDGEQVSFAGNTIFSSYLKHGGFTGNLSMTVLDEKDYNYKDMPLGKDDTYQKLSQNCEADKKIGNDKLFYRRILNCNEQHSRIATLTGDRLCVVADSGEDSSIYAVNIKTNETIKINPNKLDDAIYAVIEDDYFYYVSGGKVYKGNVKSGVNSAEICMGELKNYDKNCHGNPFAVHGGKVYWRDMNEKGELYRVGSNNCLNPGGNLSYMSIVGDNNEYLACYFDETQSARYRLIIFDKGGKEVFKTSDVARNAVIEGKTLYYYNVNTETICKVML